MIEKRTMGYVDFAYPRIKETTVTVFFNTDTNKVELLQEYEDDDDSWRAPSETDLFFPTAEEARKAMDEYKHGLIAKMPEIKLYLKSMKENVSGSKNNNTPVTLFIML